MTILTGEFSQLHGSYYTLQFGDLYSSWSSYQDGTEPYIWLYGDDSENPYVIWYRANVDPSWISPWSNADVSCDGGLSFADDHCLAQIGTTAYFKGADSQGSWNLESLTRAADGALVLNGSWTWSDEPGSGAAPVPEPSGAILFALALFIFAWWQRR